MPDEDLTVDRVAVMLKRWNRQRKGLRATSSTESGDEESSEASANGETNGDFESGVETGDSAESGETFTSDGESAALPQRSGEGSAASSSSACDGGRTDTAAVTDTSVGSVSCAGSDSDEGSDSSAGSGSTDVGEVYSRVRRSFQMTMTRPIKEKNATTSNSEAPAEMSVLKVPLSSKGLIGGNKKLALGNTSSAEVAPPKARRSRKSADVLSKLADRVERLSLSGGAETEKAVEAATSAAASGCASEHAVDEEPNLKKKRKKKTCDTMKIASLKAVKVEDILSKNSEDVTNAKLKNNNNQEKKSGAGKLKASERRAARVSGSRKTQTCATCSEKITPVDKRIILEIPAKTYFHKRYLVCCWEVHTLKSSFLPRAVRRCFVCSSCGRQLKKITHKRVGTVLFCASHAPGGAKEPTARERASFGGLKICYRCKCPVQEEDKRCV